MPLHDPHVRPLDTHKQPSRGLTARQGLLVAFYVALLASMAAVIWIVTPPTVPKPLLVLLAWGLVILRVYLEVRFRRSSWGRVLRLTTAPSSRH